MLWSTRGALSKFLSTPGHCQGSALWQQRRVAVTNGFGSWHLGLHLCPFLTLSHATTIGKFGRRLLLGDLNFSFALTILWDSLGRTFPLLRVTGGVGSEVHSLLLFFFCDWVTRCSTAQSQTHRRPPSDPGVGMMAETPFLRTSNW